MHVIELAQSFWLWLAVVAVGAVAFFYVFALCTATLVYRRLRLQTGALHRADRAEFPPEALVALDALQPPLQALGFTRVASCWHFSPIRLLPQQPLPNDLYRHADGRAWAVVNPTASGIAAIPGTVEWVSCFADGTCWVGLNGQSHQALPPPPGWLKLDTTGPDLASAWAIYAERLAATPAAAIDDTDTLIERLHTELARTPERLCAQGIAVAAEDGCVRLTWRQALSSTWRVLRGQAAAARATAPPPHLARVPATPEQALARQHAEAQAFARQLALERASRQTRAPRTMFWVTALLFIAVGAVAWNWQMALMLLAVIALHEAGHWLAMRWLGYQQPSVFFLPGLGAMTTGEKADATPLQKVLMYLAGPTPGLLLGAATVAAVGWGWVEPPTWVMQLALICLILNGFNLLPLLPLDGGRVFETLLFLRLPTLRLLFALVGTAAFAALAWFSRDPVLGALAGFLLLALPWQWRQMQLEWALYRAHPSHAPVDADTATHRLFSALQQPAFARWSLTQRIVAVRNLLPALQARKPGWAEGTLGLLMYLACLLLPVSMVTSVGIGTPQFDRAMSALLRSEMQTYSPEEHLGQIEAQLAAAALLPEAERVQAYLGVAEQLTFLDNDTGTARVKQLYQQLWTLTEARSPLDEERAQTLLGLAKTADTPEQAIAWRQQLLAELQHAQGPVRYWLAQAQEALVHGPPAGQTRAQQLALLHQAVNNYRAASDLDDYALLSARRQLASLLDDSGYAAAALAQLQANVAALQAGASTAPNQAALQWWRADQLMEAQTLQAWFLIDHGQARAALDLIQASAARATPSVRQDMPYTINASLRAGLWAAIEANEPAQVRQALQRLDQHLDAQRSPLERTSRRSRLHRLDQLVAAQVLGDGSLHQEALTGLRPKTEPSLDQCRPSNDFCQARTRPALYNDWQERARARQRAAASDAGLCPASLQT